MAIGRLIHNNSFTERKYSFGKIDYNGTGRKINLVELSVTIYDDGGRFRFAVSGCIWNSTHTDCVIAGQMIDEIQYVPEDYVLFQEIKRLWSKYHLKYKSYIPPKDWAKIVALMNLPKNDPLARRL